MKLFLTSSTITPNLVAPFEQFIGRSSVGLKVAFIPDAGFKTPGDTSWIDEERQQLVHDLDWQVDQIILKNETNESLHKLFDYDIIYVNGGYLAEVMRESGFDILLPKLLEKGIVYVGSSAGSMVLSKIQDAASFYFSEPEPEALEIGGLGVVGFEFYPLHDHFWTENLVDKIRKKRNTSLDYYLVKDGSAISIQNQTIQTYGDVILLQKESF